MTYDHLIGNSRVKQSLETMKKKGTPPQAILFCGPDGVGKKQFAKAFAHDLLGAPLSRRHHPDLASYSPEGKVGLHSMESMRQLSEQVYLPPLQGFRKVVIIEDADRMLTYSSNALLKTVEEPPLDTTLILVSSAPERLLPTMTSRCQRLFFAPLKQNEVVQILTEKERVPHDSATGVARLSQGSVSQALELLHPDWQWLTQELTALFSKPTSDYPLFQKMFRQWVERFQNNEKELLASAQQTLSPDLPKLAKEAAEKEADGQLSLFRFRQLKILSSVLHHLLLKSSTRQLERLSHLQQRLADAFLSLERSTPLASCVETLLLQTLFKIAR